MTPRFPKAGGPAHHINLHAGFTLIEVLVTFTVLAILTIAVQRGVAVSISSISRADSYLHSELVARTLMTGPLGEGPDATLGKSGRLDGYDWAIRFESLPQVFQPNPDTEVDSAGWIPVRMIIEITPPQSSAQTLKIETVRLVKVRGP